MVRRLDLVFFLLFFLTACFINIDGNFWACKWSALVLGAAAFFSFHVGGKIHWSVGICSAYFIINTISRITIIHTYTTENPTELMMYWWMAYSVVVFMLILFVLSTLDNEDLDSIFMLFCTFIVLHSAYVIFQYYYNGKSFGFLGEPSMSACLMGLCLPCLLNFTRGYCKLIALIPFVAVFHSGSTTTGIALTFVALALYVTRQVKINKYLIGGVILGVGIALGYASVGQLFFNPGDRFSNQIAIMKMFPENFTSMFGLGAGSFFSFAVATKPAVAGSGYWSHLHSDLLKLIFEHGIMGVILFTVPVFYALKNSFKEAWLFATMLTTIFYCIIQYPVFFPVHLFVCFLVFVRSIRTGHESDPHPVPRI